MISEKKQQTKEIKKQKTEGPTQCTIVRCCFDDNERFVDSFFLLLTFTIQIVRSENRPLIVSTLNGSTNLCCSTNKQQRRTATST